MPNPPSTHGADELAKAERVCRQRLQADPRDVDALRGLAAVSQAKGRYEEAVGHYQHALHEAPDDPEAHRSLGNAFYLWGRYPEAAECYRRALRLRPDDADAHNNL